MSMSAHALTDSWTMTRRELAHWARQPVQVVVNLVFPVMLLLMFGYLVGGGRGVQGSYVDYLLPGMLALTMAFGLEGTMIAVTQDLNKGGHLRADQPVEERGKFGAEVSVQAVGSGYNPPPMAVQSQAQQAPAEAKATEPTITD